MTEQVVECVHMPRCLCASVHEDTCFDGDRLRRRGCMAAVSASTPVRGLKGGEWKQNGVRLDLALN